MNMASAQSKYQLARETTEPPSARVQWLRTRFVVAQCLEIVNAKIAAAHTPTPTLETVRDALQRCMEAR